MLARLQPRWGGARCRDKNYDTKDFVAGVRGWGSPACRVEHQQPQVSDRWAHHPPRRAWRVAADRKRVEEPLVGSRPSAPAASSALGLRDQPELCSARWRRTPTVWRTPRRCRRGRAGTDQDRPRRGSRQRVGGGRRSWVLCDRYRRHARTGPIPTTEHAAPTWKRGFGFHPLLAYLDATGEALAGVLRAGNAGSGTAL